MLRGYYQYYGISDNSQSLYSLRYRAERSLFYWLNRRSQKRSYTWEQFRDVLRLFSLAKPRIYVNIYR